MTSAAGLALLALLGCPKDKNGDSGTLPDGGTPTGTLYTTPGATTTGTTDVTTTENLDCIIAFYSRPGTTGERQVYVSPPDGRSPTAVSTIAVAPSGEPRFSPDGRGIAYRTEVDHPNGNWPDGVAVAWVDPSTAEVFEWFVDGPDFAWTLDGTQLVLSGRASDDSDYYDLYLWTPGGSRTNLTQTPTEWETLVDVSPADGRILFESSTGLSTLSPAGGAATPLPNTTQLYGVRFSPDGSRISAVFRGTPDDSVVLLDADGSNRTTIYQAPDLSQTQWSPSGDALAVTDDTGNLHVIDPAGTVIGTWPLPTRTGQIAWGPNGTVLYVFSYDTGLHQLDPSTGQTTSMNADARNIGVSPNCHGSR